MTQPLPYRVDQPPSAERYLDDLHSAPAAAPFASAVNNLPPEHVQLLLRRQLRLAGEARTSRPKFFEFVFRDETAERKAIRTAAHQRVVFEFIRHYRFCVIRLPTNFSKTYCMAADGLFGLGRNPAQTGAFISAAESQAAKPLGMVRSYIEQSPELRLVFPGLVPSERPGEPWTQSDITVKRPFGIRDPSVIAVGLDSARLPGARLTLANIDDILDAENTNTDESRKKTTSWIKSTVLSRFNPGEGRCVFTNTPWHPEDATYRLERDAKWASLNMDCWGGVWFENADSFDSDELRPSKDFAQEEAELAGLPAGADVKADLCRLVAHDRTEYSFAAVPLNADKSAVEKDPSGAPMEPRGSIAWVGDVEELVPLWPERFTTPLLLEERATMGGGSEWARTKEIKTRADEDVRVQDDWLKACKAKARARGYFASLPRWTDGNAFTGVDLGFGKSRKSGNVAVFSFAVLPDMHRLVLDVDVFKYKGGKHVLEKVRQHHDRFGSIVGIESNAAQRLLKEWALDLDVSMRLRSFETNRNKNAPEFGVESIFLEIENGAWLIPSTPRDQVSDSVAHWIDDMQTYARGAHTGDVLMASWIAREQARLTGALRKGKDFWGAGFAGINTR